MFSCIPCFGGWIGSSFDLRFSKNWIFLSIYKRRCVFIWSVIVPSSFLALRNTFATLRLSQQKRPNSHHLNFSDHERLRRPQYDRPRPVRFQHGEGRVRHNGRQEAWRSSTASEIIHSHRDTLDFESDTCRFCDNTLESSGAHGSWSLTLLRLEFILCFGESTTLDAFGLGNSILTKVLDTCNTIHFVTCLSFGHTCCLLSIHWPRATSYTLLIRALCIGFGFPASTFLFLRLDLHPSPPSRHLESLHLARST